MRIQLLKYLCASSSILEWEQKYLLSQSQQPGIKQKEGVRGQVRGSGDLSVSAALCHTLGKGKQTVLACGAKRAQQGGRARSGVSPRTGQEEMAGL